MRRLPITLAVLGGLLLATETPLAAAGPAARAQLGDLVCQRALDPPARAISITALMRPLTGTVHMQMRVELLSRIAGATAFVPVATPPASKLGSWITPPSPSLGQRPGDRWKVSFPVADLPAPASYRYQASFRWTGAHGKVLATIVRTSGGCHQPELRADLLVQSLTVQPIAGHPKLDQYVAVIGNAGSTAARNFEVEFSDATKVRTAAVTVLRAHSARTISFTGPACLSTAPPTVTLDPQNQVDDFDRDNNVATASCT